MRETIIDVRGATIRALEGGAGATILYLHGLDGPRVNPLLDELVKTHHVIAPEIPGFGRSSLPDWMVTIADVALFGLDLVEALKPEKLHLAGHCVGGWIASEMAVRHATPFVSLTLIAPMGVLPKELPRGDIFLPAPDAVVRMQFHDAALAEKEIVARADEDIDIVLQNRMGLARLGWTPRFANLQLPVWLHRVKTPTLVFWGEEDRVAPVDCSEIFKREIGNCEVIRYAACGHAAPWERGVDIAQRMQALIAQTCIPGAPE